jgi:2-polyprenyl-6-methoxyphenol hydroxylase-like FAD-dependent oxidoreductase
MNSGIRDAHNLVWKLAAVLLRPDHYVAAALPLRQAVADPEAFRGLLPSEAQQCPSCTSGADKPG